MKQFIFTNAHLVKLARIFCVKKTERGHISYPIIFEHHKDRVDIYATNAFFVLRASIEHSSIIYGCEEKIAVMPKNIIDSICPNRTIVTYSELNGIREREVRDYTRNFDYMINDIGSVDAGISFKQLDKVSRAMRLFDFDVVHVDKRKNWIFWACGREGVDTVEIVLAPCRFN